jgi:hypothetical protein
VQNNVYAVVSPSGDTVVAKAGLSPRLATLEGNTVGLVWNRVFRGDETLPVIGELLQDRFPNLTVVPWDEFPATSPMDLHATKQQARLKELRDALLDKRVDAVIAGNAG